MGSSTVTPLVLPEAAPGRAAARDAAARLVAMRRRVLANILGDVFAVDC